ncbi:hypothetical protein BD0115_05130 [Helicobacter pylori]
MREIGDKGINIETRVRNAFERETQGIVNEIAKIETGFKPPKQKSQTSLVFGMNALVPLGTIKTL